MESNLINPNSNEKQKLRNSLTAQQTIRLNGYLISRDSNELKTFTAVEVAEQASKALNFQVEFTNVRSLAKPLGIKFKRATSTKQKNASENTGSGKYYTRMKHVAKTLRNLTNHLSAASGLPLADVHAQIDQLDKMNIGHRQDSNINTAAAPQSA